MPHRHASKSTSKIRQPAATQRRLPVWFVMCVCGGMLSLSLLLWFTRPGKIADQHPLPVTFQVDVNHADVMTLAGLPGLGMKTGQRIIDHRQAHGRFETPSDLTAVNGIGEAKLQQLLPWIYCGQGVTAVVIDATNDDATGAQKSGSPDGELPLEESSTLPGELSQ